MIWVDYCIIAVFILSVAVGLLRGFTREALGLATWIFALGLSWLFGKVGAGMLEQQIADPAIRLGCAYALLFLGGLLVGSLVTAIVSEVVKHTFLVGPDRMLGAGFGLVRAVVFVAAFVLVAATMGAAQDRWWQQSVFVGKFEWLARGLGTLVPERWLEALRADPTSSQTQQSS
jgi:membrane protein required for colicin V production